MTITAVIPNLGMKRFLRCDSGTGGLAGQLLRKRNSTLRRLVECMTRDGGGNGEDMTDNRLRYLQLFSKLCGIANRCNCVSEIPVLGPRKCLS
jgi:hypothetical protein